MTFMNRIKVTRNYNNFFHLFSFFDKIVELLNKKLI
jgi:hypothetical protein